MVVVVVAAAVVSVVIVFCWCSRFVVVVVVIAVAVVLLLLVVDVAAAVVGCWLLLLLLLLWQVDVVAVVFVVVAAVATVIMHGCCPLLLLLSLALSLLCQPMLLLPAADAAERPLHPYNPCVVGHATAVFYGVLPGRSKDGYPPFFRPERRRSDQICADFVARKRPEISEKSAEFKRIAW